MLIYPSLYLPIFRRKKRILTRFIRDIVTKLLGFRRTQNIYFLCLLANLAQKEGPQKSKDKHTECFTGKHTETCKLTGTCRYLYLQGIQFICQFQHTSVLHPLLIVLRSITLGPGTYGMIFCQFSLCSFMKFGIKKFCQSHRTEAVVLRCSVKKVFLEISQNSQESTYARVSLVHCRLFQSVCMNTHEVSFTPV